MPKHKLPRQSYRCAIFGTVLEHSPSDQWSQTLAESLRNSTVHRFHSVVQCSLSEISHTKSNYCAKPYWNDFKNRAPRLPLALTCVLILSVCQHLPYASEKTIRPPAIHTPINPNSITNHILLIQWDTVPRAVPRKKWYCSVTKIKDRKNENGSRGKRKKLLENQQALFFAKKKGLQ